MCLQCHQHMSNETVLQQFSDSLLNPQFKEWNDTSISHLCIAYIGTNGEECITIAKELLEAYIEWKKDNLKSNDGTFFGQPKPERVRKMVTNSDNVIAYMKEHNITDVRHAIYGDDETCKVLMDILTAGIEE